MKEKMNIGIIGAGAMARAISQHAIKAGYSIMLSNSRGPESLKSLANTIGCVAGTVHDAIEFSDIIIVAIPLGKYQELPSNLLANKIVIELLNYFPQRDGYIPELEHEEITTSELLAKHLSKSRIVKAFNSITVDDLESDARPAGASDRRAIPIAGDDEESKIVATQIINELGFDAVDSGGLVDSWRFERFRPVYCVALNKDTLQERLLSTKRDSKVPDGYWLYNRQV